MVIIQAFQACDGGSIPLARSSFRSISTNVTTIFKISESHKTFFDVDRIGLLCSWIGTVLIIKSTNFFASNVTFNGLGGEEHPFVIGEHPEYLKIGLGLTAFGFWISYSKKKKI